MPVRLRQYLTTYVNLCWVIGETDSPCKVCHDLQLSSLRFPPGQIICSGVNRAFVDNDTEWAYKIPFAIQVGSPDPAITTDGSLTLRPDPPVDLAYPHLHRNRVRARIALVAGPQGQIRRCQTCHHEAYQSQVGFHPGRRQETVRDDDPQQRVGNRPKDRSLVCRLLQGYQPQKDRDCLCGSGRHSHALDGIPRRWTDAPCNPFRSSRRSSVVHPLPVKLPTC